MEFEGCSLSMATPRLFTSRSPITKSMIRQSGLGKRRWYALHAGEDIDTGS